MLLDEKDVKLLTTIYQNFDKLILKSGQFPLSFCHGDLKSPNIFYRTDCESKNDFIPVFLDWQYIHLNKGISDIVFLLTESTSFDKDLTDMVLKYYLHKSTLYTELNELMVDFKTCLCVFPFFVLVWFNSENRDNLLDKVFPINFMKNVLKFYNEYLDIEFFQNL
jgi:Ser/Thr protein kinase RdoA (MazF antagonist)